MCCDVYMRICEANSTDESARLVLLCLQELHDMQLDLLGQLIEHCPCPHLWSALIIATSVRIFILV